MKGQLLKRFEDEVATLERELKMEPRRRSSARASSATCARTRELLGREGAPDLRTGPHRDVAPAHERDRADEHGEDPARQGGLRFDGDAGESTGQELVYQLVAEDADGEKGLISTSSPIGRAILNREEGDGGVVTTPAGARRFESRELVTIHDE